MGLFPSIIWPLPGTSGSEAGKFLSWPPARRTASIGIANLSSGFAKFLGIVESLIFHINPKQSGLNRLVPIFLSYVAIPAELGLAGIFWG